MPFSREVQSKRISREVLQARNRNINVTGLAFGDSTLFVGDRNRPAIFKWDGTTLSSLISRGRLRSAAASAASRFGDTTPAQARLNIRIGGITFIGDSTLVVGDTGNNYLLYFNSVSGIGDSSRHFMIDSIGVSGGSQLRISGLAPNGGDSVPLIYSNSPNQEGVFERKLIRTGAVFTTESYTTTTFKEVPVSGTRTEYRVSGDRPSGTDSFGCGNINTSAGEFRKNRVRYRRQSGWNTSRTGAINAARTTEQHRVRYTTGCGTGARVCYLSGNCGSTTRTVTTTRTTTVTTTKQVPTTTTTQVQIQRQTTTTRQVPTTTTVQTTRTTTRTTSGTRTTTTTVNTTRTTTRTTTTTTTTSRPVTFTCKTASFVETCTVHSIPIPVTRFFPPRRTTTYTTRVLCRTTIRTRDTTCQGTHVITTTRPTTTTTTVNTTRQTTVTKTGTRTTTTTVPATRTTTRYTTATIPKTTTTTRTVTRPTTKTVSTTTTRTVTTTTTRAVSGSDRPYANIPDDFSTYEPIIQTRQVTAGVGTERVLTTTTRTRQVQVSAGVTEFIWEQKYPREEMTRAGIPAAYLSRIGGITRDGPNGGLFLAGPTKVYYSPAFGSLDTRHELGRYYYYSTPTNYGPQLGGPLWPINGIAWDGEGIYISNSNQGAIFYYRREDIIARIRSGISRIEVSVVEPPLPPFHRIGDSRDIDIKTTLHNNAEVVGLAWYNGSIYAGDRYTRRIYKINPSTKTSEVFFTFSSTENIDSLTFGDSNFWVGDDVNRQLVKINTSGDTNGIFNIPSGFVPTGIAHLGDTGTYPYIIDSTNKQILNYETRTIINPPVFGDSYYNVVGHEFVETPEIITKYRVSGDSEIQPDYVSCGDSGDSFNYTSKRWLGSNVLFDSGDSAIKASEYNASFRSFCSTRTVTYQEQIQTTKTIRGDSITEYKITGDRASGSSGFSCVDLDPSNQVFSREITRYSGDSNVWYSSLLLAEYNARYTNKISTPYTTQEGSGDCRVGDSTSTTYANIPSTVLTEYSPTHTTRQIQGALTTTTTTRFVTRSGERTSHLLRRFTPVIEEVGDTTIVRQERQTITRVPTKIELSPGTEFPSTDWHTKISRRTLLALNEAIRPTGLSFGPNGDLFLLDANNDTVFFLYKGLLRRARDEYYDLPKNVLRGENFNIFPAALVWDQSDGFYISDTQAKKLWYYRYYPKIEAEARSGISRIAIKAKVAGAEARSGISRIAIKATKYIHPTISVGNTGGRIQITPREAIPIKTQIRSGDSSRINAVGLSVETKFISLSVRSGSGRINASGLVESHARAFFGSGAGRINIEVTKNIHPTLSMRSGRGSIETEAKAFPPVGNIEARSGGASISIKVEKRNSQAGSISARSGSGKIEVNAVSSAIINPSFSIRSGRSRIETEAVAFTLVNKYISLKTQSARSRIEIGPVEVVPASSFEADDASLVSVPITRIATPSSRSEISKYRAVGFYELSTTRTISPRANLGDSFPNTPYPYPQVTREPTPVTLPIPQLLPPTLTVRQQGREVVLHWSEQHELYNSRVELQVSQNEDGPWFGPDLSGGDTITTGDSFSTSEGFEEVLTNIPLKGTPDIPEPRALCYRVRRVSEFGEKSEWSQASMVVVKPIQEGDVGSNSIGAAKLKGTIYGSQGEGSKLAYWSLDDTLEGKSPFSLSSMQDTSQEGPIIPLLVSGPEIREANGINGRGLELDGINNGSYLITPPVGRNGENWSSLSFLAFIKGDSEQPQNIVGLISYWSSAFDFSVSYVKTTRILRIRTNKAGVVSTLNSDPLTLLDNEWKQIGFSVGDSKMGLWLNGEKIKETRSGDLIPKGGYFSVGGIAGNNFSGFKLKGIVDEIRLWERSLAAEEFKFFRNFPGGNTTDIITNANLLQESIDVSKVTTDFFETGFAKVRNSIQIGQPINVESGNLRTHADADEFSLQKFNGTTWENEGSFYQTPNGSFLDVGNSQISPSGITIERGNNRSFRDENKIVFDKKIGSVWFKQLQIEKEKIVFYDDAGVEKRIIDKNPLNLGDTIYFDDFIVTKDEEKLNFQGIASFNSIEPQNRFIGQMINQRELFLLLTRNSTNWVKIHGTGFLNDNVGGNQIFEGNIVLGEKKSSNLFHLHCVNTKTKQAQILNVNSHLQTKLFDVVTMEF